MVPSWDLPTPPPAVVAVGATLLLDCCCCVLASCGDVESFVAPQPNTEKTEFTTVLQTDGDGSALHLLLLLGTLELAVDCEEIGRLGGATIPGAGK